MSNINLYGGYVVLGAIGLLAAISIVIETVAIIRDRRDTKRGTK